MGHVVKAKERAEVKRYGGRLHHFSFNRSPTVQVHIQQVLPTFNVYHFLFILLWCSLLILFLLCLIRFFLFLRLGEGRPLPPLRTTTLIQTRAPQQLHTQELGFCRMQLATISNACAKQKRKLVSQELDTRVKRCAESQRDPGRWKEKGGSDHLAHRASHLDTLRSEKSHRFLYVPVTIFFLS